MSDQGFGVSRQLSEQQVRVTTRPVPLGPAVLGPALATFATVPPQQMMKVQQLAVCNPTAAAVTLVLTVARQGGPAIAQIPGLSVDAGAAVDLTAMVGGLYLSDSVLQASGEGLVLSGWYEAVL